MVEEGFPGSPKKNFPRGAAENQRLSGLDQDAVEIEFGAEFRQHLLDDVVFAGGNAAGEQQQIGLQAAVDHFARVFHGVARHGQQSGTPPARATCAASE